MGFPGASDGKESAYNGGDLGLIRWRRKWQPTPVFLPEKVQGQEELGGLLSMGLQRVGHDCTSFTQSQITDTGQSFWVFVYLWPIILFVSSHLTCPSTLPMIYAQLFAKMDPSAEAYGCMSTLIMGWYPCPFDP